MPDIKTLPKDIYSLLNPDTDHQPDEDNLNALSEVIKGVMRSQLRQQKPRDTPIRFSNLGRPDRQVWYDAHPDGTAEKIPEKAYLKFLYGHIIEAVLLFLAKEAGHTVEMEQAEVDEDGVKGHIDAKIDGVVVDVKSASPYGYKKFESGTVYENDAFGYVEQLAGYANKLTPGEDAFWLAAEKVDGSLCLSKLDKNIIEHHQPGPRIAHLREVISSPEPPARCYDPEPFGKSGNMALPTVCSYCPHHFRCHDNLRVFLYSNGPKYLSTVAKTPDVPELKRVEINNT